MFEIQELKVVKEIIDRGSFSIAAKELFLTQSAVSQSLANLERKLDTQVIIRGRPPRLTPIGEELYHHAQRMINGEKELVFKLNRMKKGQYSSLNIGFDHLAAKTFIPDLTQYLNNIYPEMNIGLFLLPGREIVHSLKSKKLDFAFGPFQSSMGDFHTKTIKTARSYLVTGKKNKLLKIYKKDPIQFLRCSTLLTSYLDDPSVRPSRKKIRDFFKDVWLVNDLEVQLSLLSRGIGATFLSENIIENRSLPKDIVKLEQIPFYMIRKNYGIYYLKDRVLTDLDDEVLGFNFN